jgi:uncharacterized membrane protein
MKLILPLLAVAAMALPVAGWTLAHHYTFVVTDGGNTVYRCNHFTGVTQFATPRDREWITINEPTP